MAFWDSGRSIDRVSYDMTIIEHSPLNGNDVDPPEVDTDPNGGDTAANEETTDMVLNETNQQQLRQQQKDEAVMMALINIYNCMKGPHKKFDEISLENFKSRNRTAADILTREFGDISTKVDWLTALNDYATTSENDMVRNQRKTVFAILGGTSNPTEKTPPPTQQKTNGLANTIFGFGKSILNGIVTPKHKAKHWKRTEQSNGITSTEQTRGHNTTRLPKRVWARQ